MRMGESVHKGIGCGVIDLTGITYGGKSIDVTIDERMYQTATGILINVSKVYKFGFRVGEILLVMVKPQDR